MRRMVMVFLLAAGAAGAVRAEPVRVVTDIAPVRSIVARVMQGLGEPALLVPPGASPHDHAMRPSEARALASADLVVWIGPELTGWLADPLAALAPQAHQVVLAEVPGTTRLTLRDLDAAGEVGDHEGHDEDHENHDDDHADHGDDHAAHDTHDNHDAHGAHDHAAGGLDPHLWLDPRNAMVWTEALARELAVRDPGNAERYHANARAAVAELGALEAALTTQLAPVADRPFLVLHDAFAYAEARFGLSTPMAVTDGHAAPPGPGRLARLRALVEDRPVACAFTEPQAPRALLDRVLEGQPTLIVPLDVMGPQDGPLSDRYPALMENLAGAMLDCLQE